MTTVVTVTNEGPDRLVISYYATNRQFKEEQTVLKPGESTQITVWDGHVPVLQAVRNHHGSDGNPKFYAIPPATM